MADNARAMTALLRQRAHDKHSHCNSDVWLCVCVCAPVCGCVLSLISLSLSFSMCVCQASRLTDCIWVALKKEQETGENPYAHTHRHMQSQYWSQNNCTFTCISFSVCLFLCRDHWDRRREASTKVNVYHVRKNGEAWRS